MRMEGLSCNAFVAKIFYQINFTISIWITWNFGHNPCSREVTFCRFVLILTSSLPYLKANLCFVNTAPANIIGCICRIRVRNDPANQSSISNEDNICRIRIPLCPKILCTRNSTPQFRIRLATIRKIKLLPKDELVFLLSIPCHYMICISCQKTEGKYHQTKYFFKFILILLYLRITPISCFTYRFNKVQIYGFY